MSKVRLVLAYLSAVISACLAASFFSSQFVYSALEAIGTRIAFSERMISSIKDIGILESFLPLMGIAFLIAFTVAHFVVKKFNVSPALWFAVAGASSWLFAILILEAVFGLMPIGGARTALGLLFQTLAGMLGGLVFYRIAFRSS